MGNQRGFPIARYTALIALSIVFALPFLWMVGTSLTPPEEILNRYRSFFPGSPHWQNYWSTLRPPAWGGYLPFHLFLKNTLIVTLLCVIGQTLSASLVAFAFARLDFPLRGPLFLLVLSTMMLPPQVTMIPTFKLWTIPGWIDSLKPLIIPSFFGGGAFFIFLLRQFFMTIPKELEEAARLDGCSSWGVYRHVIIPNAK